MSTHALSTPTCISSLSLLLVQTQAARWKAVAPEQLTGTHLYLDIPKSGYLFHGYSGGKVTSVQFWQWCSPSTLPPRGDNHGPCHVTSIPSYSKNDNKFLIDYLLILHVYIHWYIHNYLQNTGCIIGSVNIIVKLKSFDARCTIRDVHFNMFISSLSPRDSCMCQWDIPSLVKIMYCRLIGARPLSEPMLIYY